MADASLDDIIKRRKFRPGNQQGNRTHINGALGRNRPPLKGRLNQSVRADLGIIVSKVGGDVRNKIIQKKRLRLRDARDRLAEIAKQGDARDRINKMRKKPNTQPNLVKKIPAAWKNTAVVEKNIRNENHPSYSQGKTKMQGSSLIRTVSGGNRGIRKDVVVQGKPSVIPKNLSAMGRPQSITKTTDGNRYHPLPNNPHVVTIKNEKADLYTQAVNSYRPREMRSPPMKFFTRNPPIRSMGLSTTVSHNPRLSGMRSDAMSRGWSPEHFMYRTRSPEPEEIRPTRLRITTANNYREPSPHYSDDWESPTRLPARLPSRMLASRMPAEIPERLAVRVPAKKRPMYEDLDSPSRPKKVAPLSSGLMARLDNPVHPPPEEGKVLVTNLHRCVSVEDMEELFGTIGPIRTARMLREGIAEAVFMSMEDAYRAVEVFNNRQLDGQPMSVSVVNKKTQSLPAAPMPPAPPRTQTKSVLKAARFSGDASFY